MSCAILPASPSRACQADSGNAAVRLMKSSIKEMRHAELTWLQSETGKLHRSIAKNIAKVDQVLAMVGYRDDPGTIRKHRRNAPRMFRRGQLRRLIYDILREGPCIATDRQFAVEVISRCIGIAAMKASFSRLRSRCAMCGRRSGDRRAGGGVASLML